MTPRLHNGIRAFILFAALVACLYSIEARSAVTALLAIAGAFGLMFFLGSIWPERTGPEPEWIEPWWRRIDTSAGHFFVGLYFLGLLWALGALMWWLFRGP